MKIENIRRVLILGSGTMGQQIGLICALHGYQVVMYDIQKDILEKALTRLKRKSGKMVKMNRFSGQEVEAALARIKITDNAEEASENVDLISESVPEDPELKGSVFARFNKLCKKETIFTTNSSSLVPSMFAEATGRPDKLCALHFHDIFMNNIVDVMPHPGTSPQTCELVKAFAESIGQITIMLNKEHNGYVFNHMLMAFLDSALNLASNDIAPIRDIDRSWMGIMNSPVGPFGIMDVIGLDTVYKITDYWAKELDNPNAKENASFLKGYTDRGALGLKTGKGFYAYPNPEYSRPGFIKNN